MRHRGSVFAIHVCAAGQINSMALNEKLIKSSAAPTRLPIGNHAETFCTHLNSAIAQQRRFSLCLCRWRKTRAVKEQMGTRSLWNNSCSPSLVTGRRQWCSPKNGTRSLFSHWEICMIKELVEP